MLDIDVLFFEVDTFYQSFVPPESATPRLPGSKRRRNRPARLHPSEVVTILVLFQSSNHRCFKHFYIEHVMVHLRREFPKLVSYQRFVELMPRCLELFFHYLMTRMGTCTGVSFVDSTKLPVCDNRRIGSHRVMVDVARRGKTSTGWFYGLKLHIVVSDVGEILGFQITPGNVDDRKPVEHLMRGRFGFLFGDRGYIDSKLFERLYHKKIKLITKIKKNMKNKLMNLVEKLTLQKRGLVETIFDQLKNEHQIQHTRHRSPLNYLVNLLAGLTAYTWREKKPRVAVATAMGPLFAAP